MTRQIHAFVFLLFVAAAAVAEPPSFAFKREGVTVGGVKPGTRLVWLALTREREAHHAKMSADRGVAVVTGNGTVAIKGAGLDKSRSLWLFADLDGTLVTGVTPPGYMVSHLPISAQATAGSDRITITSPFIHLVYVNRGGSAYSITASDGGLNDADGVQDAQIVLTLSTLERFHGSGDPLRIASVGDVLLMIDPFANRMTSLEVRP